MLFARVLRSFVTVGTLRVRFSAQTSGGYDGRISVICLTFVVSARKQEAQIAK
jgi:hypothetical protein